MTILKNPPTVRKFVQKYAMSILRIISVYKISALIIAAIAFGLLLFYVIKDDGVEQKFGTLANIVIATAVCWMSFSSYHRSNVENRKNELEKSCTSVVEVILSHGNRDDNGNIFMKFFGKDGKVINAFGGRRYFSQWLFIHHAKSEYSVFQIHVQRMNKDGTYIISDSSESIMCRSGPSGWNISTLRYAELDKIDDPSSGVAINADKISGNDWEALMQAIGYIHVDIGPKI